MLLALSAASGVSSARPGVGDLISMGLASKPAQQGDASSAAPSQPFDEAAAYAAQQAEANPTNGTPTGGCHPVRTSPALDLPACCRFAKGTHAYLVHAGAHNSGTPATAGAAAPAPPAAAAANSGAASAGPTPPPYGQHPPQQVPPSSGHQPQTAPPSGGQWANPGNPSQPVQGVPVRCAPDLCAVLHGILQDHIRASPEHGYCLL